MKIMATTRGKLAIQPAIDIGEGFEPPLDFTFMCLTSASDCLDEEPRERATDGKKYKTRVVDEDGMHGMLVKRKTNALRLSNNVITDWKDLTSTIEKLIQNPYEDLEWIDLSFNDLTCIDKSLLEFRNLKVLYLHGNGIEKISEVDKLSQLPHLKNLTLHGNPIEDGQKGYRQYVLSRVPLLKNFDFSCVTKSDRACAQTWSQMCHTKRKSKT